MSGNSLAHSFVLSLAASPAVAQSTFSYPAGGLGAISYVTYRGQDAWNQVMDRCEEFEDTHKIVKGVDCGGHSLFYLASAALSYAVSGYTYASGAEYIKTLVKYSYTSPGCLDRVTIGNQNFDDALGNITYSGAYWAYHTRSGDKYSFELQDQATYGTPYIGGYLIAERDGSGTNFEGNPSLHDCWN